MMRVRRLVYRMGFRPKFGNIFFSPSLNLRYAYEEAVRTQDIQVLPPPSTYSHEFDKYCDNYDGYDRTAYETFNFCPVDGKPLELVEDYPGNSIKMCKDHPLTLFPSDNIHGEQVMVYDPHRPGRA